MALAGDLSFYQHVIRGVGGDSGEEQWGEAPEGAGSETWRVQVAPCKSRAIV